MAALVISRAGVLAEMLDTFACGSPPPKPRIWTYGGFASIRARAATRGDAHRGARRMCRPETGVDRSVNVAIRRRWPVHISAQIRSQPSSIHMHRPSLPLP